MKKLIIILAALLISVIGSSLTQAVEQTGFALPGVCVDNWTLSQSVTLNINGTVVPIQQNNISCPYGCRLNASQYGADCLNPTRVDDGVFIGNSMLVVLFELMGVILLIFAVERESIIYSITSLTIYIILSLMSFNFLSGFQGQGISIPYLGFLNLALLVASFIVTIYTFFTSGEDIVEEISPREISDE